MAPQAKKPVTRAQVESKDQRSGTAQQPRTFTDWTPARVRAAIRSADTGNLRSAVSVCEWILTDDRVESVMEARRDALLGLEVTFEASGDRRKSSRTVRALEAQSDWWRSYSEAELGLLIKWGILLGVAPARHQWLPGEGGRVLPCPRFWHPQSLRWDQQLHKWFITDDQSVELEVVPGDGSWILHTPYGEGRAWASGAWRSLAIWVLLKQLAMADWARYGERAAVFVGTSPEKSTKAQRDELAELIMSMGSEAAIVMAAGFDVRLLQATANTEQIYQRQIDLANQAIAIRIRGGNLSTVTEGGSLAAAKEQSKNNEAPKLRYDAEALSTTIREQSLVWWAEFNFGSRDVAPWPVWATEPPEDKTARATMVKTLAEGLTKFDALGYEIDDKLLVEEFGVAFLGTRKAPEDRPQKVAPPVGEAKADGEEDADDGQKEPLAKPEGQKARKVPKAEAPRMVTMASGDERRAGSPLVQSIEYTDELVDVGTTLAASFLAPTADLIVRAINGSKSYGELQAKLLEVAKVESAVELIEMLERVMVMAELAGRNGAQTDA